MPPHASDTPPRASLDASPAPILLTAGGIAAAFGVAACCGLPLVLASLGLGTAWLGGVALVAAPHRTLLMAFAAVLLFSGAAALWRQHQAAKVCRVEGVCAHPTARLATIVGLGLGLGLLVLGYLYV